MSAEIIMLCLASFGAGFIDSIVGGGGLLQIPALMMCYPRAAVVDLLATNKIVAIVGTSLAAHRFARTIRPIKRILAPAVTFAFLFGLIGAYTVTVVPNSAMKPICLVLMIAAFFFIIRNKKFGIIEHDHEMSQALWKPILLGSILGFYDGFFGPGTGGFLIIGLVSLLGLSLVQASAHAKIINVATNAAAISIFALRADVLWGAAVPMIVFNVAGTIVGVRFALLKGNTLVRGLLRSILAVTILKLAYDVFVS